MRKGLLILSTLFLSLTGCAFADKITGNNPDGTTSPSLVEKVVKTASDQTGWLGLAGTLATGLFAFYQSKRAQALGSENANYDEAVQALVTGIEKALNGGTLADVTKEDLYKFLADSKNALMSDPEFLTKLVADIKSGLRK